VGKRTAASKDQAIAVLAGSFSGTGSSESIELHGYFNVALWGGTCTVRLERTFDGGTTWIPHSADQGATLATWNITPTAPLSTVFREPELGVLYRLTCTAFTSSVSYRMSR